MTLSRRQASLSMRGFVCSVRDRLSVSMKLTSKFISCLLIDISRCLHNFNYPQHTTLASEIDNINPHLQPLIQVRRSIFLSKVMINIILLAYCCLWFDPERISDTAYLSLSFPPYMLYSHIFLTLVSILDQTYLLGKQC